MSSGAPPASRLSHWAHPAASRIGARSRAQAASDQANHVHSSCHLLRMCCGRVACHAQAPRSTRYGDRQARESTLGVSPEFSTAHGYYVSLGQAMRLELSVSTISDL